MHDRERERERERRERERECVCVCVHVCVCVWGGGGGRGGGSWVGGRAALSHVRAHNYVCMLVCMHIYIIQVSCEKMADD